MARSLRYLLIFLLTIGSVNAFAQSNGRISGTATDENGDPVIGAIIEVYSGGLKKGGAVTDIDGNYVVASLSAGTYEILGKYSSYKAVRITGISVSNDGEAKVNLDFNPNQLEVVEIKYQKPLISSTGKVNTSFDAADITHAPTRDLTKLVATSAGMVNNGRNNTLNAGGGRGGNTITMLDGVMIRGSVPNLSQQVIGEVEVELGGMPAKRGDATGAIVSITTKGPSSVYTGSVQLEKSVEGFGHNLANFTVSGPLLSKKLKGGDKKPVVGFLLNGEAIYDRNGSPSFDGNWVAKEEVRQQLEARPLVLSPNTVGAPVYNYATEFVTQDQLEKVKVTPNSAAFEGRVFGKLDYQVNDNMNLTAGVNGTYNRGSANAGNGYYNYTMFVPDAIPTRTAFTGRGYLRFTQRFANRNTNDSGAKQSRIQNAFYSLQGDYTKSYSQTQDPNHGRNIFNYGYLGKFYQNTESRYFYDVDTNTGTRMWQLVSYDAPTSYTFERAEVNPTLANYTSNFYQLGLLPPTITELRGQRGLANGDIPGRAYSLYQNVGTALTGFTYTNNDQISASANASFDLILGTKNKKRHAIEFGLYYQQSVDRDYTLNSNISDARTGGSNSLWQVMRSSVNNHIVLDMNNPVYRIGGNTYTKDQVYGPNNPNGTVIAGIFDSLYYNRISVDTAQSFFDKSLRAKLGLPVNGTDMIQLDNLDPSTFSLDMFSADELINSLNSSLVDYQGYDYLGNRLKGQVNFNDYFTAKDANGNFTRNIGAYRPNYIAGYIQDRFTFKDINFNIGVRVDRYDLNTKVLRDPYSLYETFKVGDRSNTDFAAKGDIPGNMGEDYVVYVDNNQSSSPKIIGYRNGDEWFNADGQVIQDPSALRAVSGRDPQPYLTDAGKVLMTDPNYDPTRSFTDYKPQTNISPRIAFQFPISEKSQFYAHYDILVQRPTTATYATPYDYLYLTQVHEGADNPVNNPNLKPEKTFDYEFGFSQALSSTSVISIAGTYKERKDWIQSRAYISAWPQTYYSYDNRDFSTTKGFYLKYDLRRTKNLRMLMNYTLQFVEGTGSDANSSGGSQGLLASLIASQLPNLRAVMPLDYDSRHLISANVDYRFADGEGPIIGDKHFLQNAGINLLFTARSGEPYTRYAQPTRVARTIKGELNGSRLPWHYMLDLRVDKDFTLSFKKQALDEGQSSVKKPQRMLYLNVYCFVNNVLNTRDVLSVDGFTGKPDDDGYLVSPQGVLFQSTQTSPASYYDLYSVSRYNPNTINLPRRINFGLSLNF